MNLTSLRPIAALISFVALAACSSKGGDPARQYGPDPYLPEAREYLLALPGVVSEGVGSATLRVNAAGTQATLSFTMTNMVGTPTGESINSDPYQNDPSELIFDISAGS